MRDPRRLLDGDGTDIERDLLNAGRREVPNAQAKRRAAAALAIGATTAWPAATYATAKVSQASFPLLAKLLAIGALGAGTYGAAQYVMSRSEPAPQPASVAPKPAPLPARKPASDVPAKPAEVVTPVEALEVERPADSARRSPSAAPQSGAADSGSIASEIRLLDEARRAQAAGNGASAIKALDDYRRQYPRGALSEEATLLRIEALAHGGNQAGARALAARYRAKHPDSPHLRRIDSVLGEP